MSETVLSYWAPPTDTRRRMAVCVVCVCRHLHAVTPTWQAISELVTKSNDGTQFTALEDNWVDGCSYEGKRPQRARIHSPLNRPGTGNDIMSRALPYKQKQTNSVAFSPRANYTD
jgi:hypothetical protein